MIIVQNEAMFLNLTSQFYYYTTTSKLNTHFI